MRTVFPVTVLALVVSCMTAAPVQAQRLQWLLTANENKVELIDGVSTLRAAPPPDNVTLFDIAGVAPVHAAK